MFLKVWPGTVDNEVDQWRFTMLKSADMDLKLGIKTALAVFWYCCLANVWEHRWERDSRYTKYQRGNWKGGRKAGLEKAVYCRPGCKHLFLLRGKELSLGPVEQPAVPQSKTKIYHLAHRVGSVLSARLRCSSGCNLGICWNELLHYNTQFKWSTLGQIVIVTDLALSVDTKSHG